VISTDRQLLDELIGLMRRADHIAVLTGAGTSAESGVPTFRQAQTGLWARYDPTELATPQAFRRNPRLVWEWYAWRKELTDSAEPNAGHFALARLAHLVPHLTLITQNVDSLHQRAGSPDVIELHGNLTRYKCFACGRMAEVLPVTEDVPPHCAFCDGLLRPDIVWFGESLPPGALQHALSAARHCDLFFSIGTSAVVQPAASLPIEAREKGAVIVEINPEITPLTAFASYALSRPSGEVLPELVAAAWPQAAGGSG
jgi:NAD-dependent deacetylase